MNRAKIVAGRHKVFSEISWHLAIYRVRPDVGCVVHAHPPTAGGFALAGREIGIPALPEAIVSLGRAILNTKLISPLDPDLGKKRRACGFGTASRFERERRVLGSRKRRLGRRPGDVMQTYYRLELVEQIARQHYAAETLGKIHRLTPTRWLKIF